MKRPTKKKITGSSRVPAPQRAILSKMRELPPEKVAEVEDFVDFLRQRQQESHVTRAATRLSEHVFAEVWNNPDDAAYDRL